MPEIRHSHGGSQAIFCGSFRGRRAKDNAIWHLLLREGAVISRQRTTYYQDQAFLEFAFHCTPQDAPELSCTWVTSTFKKELTYSISKKLMHMEHSQR